MLFPHRTLKEPLLQTAIPCSSITSKQVFSCVVLFVCLGPLLLLNSATGWARQFSAGQEPAVDMVNRFQRGSIGFRPPQLRPFNSIGLRLRPIIPFAAPGQYEDFEFDEFEGEMPNKPKVNLEPPPDMVVSWLPQLDTDLDDIEPSKGATILPFIPLDQMHLPYSSPKLEVLEPRYRAMYDDIFSSGARQFLVCNLDRGTQRFAEVGAMVHVDDLQNMSDTRHGRKYVGEHSVIGRAKVLKVLNPKAAETRDTYLRAEVALLEDNDPEEDESEAEEGAQRAFDELVDMQTKMMEMPRFTEELKTNISFSRGTGFNEPGLWGTIALWQEFIKVRDMQVIQTMKDEVWRKVEEFLESNPSPEVRKSLLFYSRAEQYLARASELPEPLRKNIVGLKRRFRQEIDAMTLGNDPRFQSMLQSDSYGERLLIFRHVLEEECKRLEARAALQSIFDVR